MRGIEIHDGKPIFYDTGDLFSMSSAITWFPHDFYVRHAAELRTPDSRGAACGRACRALALSPADDGQAPGGYQQGRKRAGIIAVLYHAGKGELEWIELNPLSTGTQRRASSASRSGRMRNPHSRSFPNSRP